MYGNQSNVRGRLVDLENKRIYAVELLLKDGRIADIIPVADDSSLPYLLPGFIDAHIHIESSMLVPSEFARVAVRHGTVATVSDPHEIANVLGSEGVRFMAKDAARVPFRFFFGAPSCVPATGFETAGASMDAAELASLVDELGLKYLSEMMNYPGVLYEDPDVMAKLQMAREKGIPVDGHAPGLRGEDVRRYAAAGISTDHECFSLAEALDKIAAGMKIIIREGSAAKNYEALKPLLATHPGSVMFCSDDKHPDDLLEGHIDRLVARAVADGFDLFDVLRAACVHPVQHYALPVGQLRAGDPADFVLVDSLREFRVLETWIGGKCVYNRGQLFIPRHEVRAVNQFVRYEIPEEQLRVPATGSRLRVIRAIDGELITESCIEEIKASDGFVSTDPSRDILKIVVVNRYRQAKAAVGFIKGFGLREGAIASSVAHDCHNIIVVGAEDSMILEAIRLIMEASGGIVAISSEGAVLQPLPVAGLMTTDTAEETGRRYAALDLRAKSMGSKLLAPFMTLSFMGLLVIPSLKMSDLGLFDGTSFGFVPLTED